MNAPVDPATGVAFGVAILLGGVAVIVAVAWTRQVEGRLLALKALSEDRAERSRETVRRFSDNWPEGAVWPPEVPRPTHSVPGSEDEARWVIARVRDVYGQDLMGDRFVTIVRQILGVMPRARHPVRVVAAAREALAAYRAIFATGCWKKRDRRAFAELAAALEEQDQL